LHHYCQKKQLIDAIKLTEENPPALLFSLEPGVISILQTAKPGEARQGSQGGLRRP